MANRFFMQSIAALPKGLVVIQARILMSGTTPVLQVWQPPTQGGGYGTYGTATAASAGFGGTKGGAEGVASVTRTGTGLWTLVLQDNYQRLLDWDVKQQLAGGLSTIVGVGINSTLTDLTTAGGSTVAVALLSATATAADPADTTIVVLNFLLSNSTAL